MHNRLWNMANKHEGYLSLATLAHIFLYFMYQQTILHTSSKLMHPPLMSLPAKFCIDCFKNPETQSRQRSDYIGLEREKNEQLSFLLSEMASDQEKKRFTLKSTQSV